MWVSCVLPQSGTTIQEVFILIPERGPVFFRALEAIIAKKLRGTLVRPERLHALIW